MIFLYTGNAMCYGIEKKILFCLYVNLSRDYIFWRQDRHHAHALYSIMHSIIAKFNKMLVIGNEKYKVKYRIYSVKYTQQYTQMRVSVDGHEWF